MAQTLRDFSALKGLRKEMEKQEQSASPKPVAEQKEVRTVQHRTLEEEHALNIGIEKGVRVRMMDTNDTKKHTEKKQPSNPAEDRSPKGTGLCFCRFMLIYLRWNASIRDRSHCGDCQIVK